MPTPLDVLLISTYELGRQPFGLASPAAWLRQAGARVTCADLALDPLDERVVAAADLIGFYIPMHTATRLATRLVDRVRRLNPRAHICFFGLYASLNKPFLRELGADTVLGGEFEEGLVALVERLSGPDAASAAHVQPLVSLRRQQFLVPDRVDLPALARYAQVELGDGERRVVGYTEASRGCKHLCRHCPVPAVYGGTFRVVQREVVLTDVRRQVAAGAQHITFGDPDFFNGVGHARALVTALHDEHPQLTYDVTVKVEHLLRHARELPLLRRTGCLFVTTAVESFDDRVLALLEKGHTREDFVRVLSLARDVGLHLNPTFVAFTPWTTLESFQEMLAMLGEVDLVESVAPIQLALRLLVPAGSRLLELPEMAARVGPFDGQGLVFPWRHDDPRVDRLQAQAQRLVQEASARGESRRRIFERVWALSERARAISPGPVPRPRAARARVTIPYLTEPWYC